MSAHEAAATAAQKLAELKAALDRARAIEARGDHRGALTLLAACPEHLLEFGSFHFACASLLLKVGDLKGAQEAAREAVRREPTIPEFQATLGAVLVETWRRTKTRAALDEAIEVLGAAARRGPKTTLVHNNLGMALQAAGRAEDALEAFDAARAIDRKDPSVLFNRAATLNALGRADEAIAALDETLAVAPTFEPARKSRENARKRLGR